MNHDEIQKVLMISMKKSGIAEQGVQNNGFLGKGQYA
jgi:hypothetical protein